jgi:hypothetical protein
MSEADEKSLACPIEVASDDAPVVANANSSRVITAVIISMIGVGMTIVAGITVWQGVSKHNLFGILCPGMFLIVGFALDVFAAYLILGCFNPMPVLVLSERNVYPGSEIEVSWMFRGNPKSIRRLKMTLIGTEKVTYKQGTDTRREESKFHEEVVFESEDAEQIAKGFCLVTIPVGTMHSFKASSNEIEWKIELDGDIPRWPDVLESFPFQVLTPPLPS